MSSKRKNMTREIVGASLVCHLAELPGQGNNDPEADAIDAITYILHYMNAKGISAEMVVQTAFMHFNEETGL